MPETRDWEREKERSEREKRKKNPIKVISRKIIFRSEKRNILCVMESRLSSVGGEKLKTISSWCSFFRGLCLMQIKFCCTWKENKVKVVGEKGEKWLCLQNLTFPSPFRASHLQKRKLMKLPSWKLKLMSFEKLKIIRWVLPPTTKHFSA